MKYQEEGINQECKKLHYKILNCFTKHRRVFLYCSRIILQLYLKKHGKARPSTFALRPSNLGLSLKTLTPKKMLERYQQPLHKEKQVTHLKAYYMKYVNSYPSKHSSWWRRLEDVLKMSFVFIFRRSLQDVLKTSWSRRICSP